MQILLWILIYSVNVLTLHKLFIFNLQILPRLSSSHQGPNSEYHILIHFKKQKTKSVVCIGE